ncbi:uncharacterized protein LOC123657968 [Melitaea cinxia]|uniref:uncharacterized protein LOC123657968 n=1 Tax=Melitaea cinxia TaxID=113334 RepID=UPI001E26F883|nr:uncharacterized protein LOC123657968 [Melitaea cinxia]
MDLKDKDWKEKLGFPINYDSGQSSEEDNDAKEVVMRHPRQSSRFLLEENGDGSEADLLGTTPPRARIRDKEKRRLTQIQFSPIERLKKRSSLKLIRSKEKDWKDSQREPRADSLPSPNPQAAVPTLVESCSRFMSLTSRLKCREVCETEIQERNEDELPASRVNFHNTFSMLINMGNIEKGCRRTISREEQVWQNELKDLIWLELKAKLAGRTLSQQDEFLCAQRNNIPVIVQRIREYKFVNRDPCRNKSQRFAFDGSDDEQIDQDDPTEENDDDASRFGCVSIDCGRCARAVGAAMRELAALMDAYDAAVALYPSVVAAAADHPALCEPATVDRLRAMSLWYNTAQHMRLKVLSVRRMLRSVRNKSARLAAGDAGSRKSSVSTRPCQVRFNVSNSTSDSSNSDISGHSEGRDSGVEDKGEYDNQADAAKIIHEEKQAESCESMNAHESTEDVPDSASEKCDRSVTESVPETYSSNNSTETTESGYVSEERETHDVFELGALRDVARLRLLGRSAVSAYRETSEERETHDVFELGALRDVARLRLLGRSAVSAYRETSEERETHDVFELGALRDVARLRLLGRSAVSAYRETSEERETHDVFELGALRDVARLRLLGRSAVSAYRDYHHEILKTQGVRRCLMFMNKMCNKLLIKVYLTLLESQGETVDDDNPDALEDTKESEQKTDASFQDIKNIAELRRYGCWSKECLSMRLPSYRNHFLLLTSITMEAVHDYLSLRMEGRPENPSCLTIKQLIHELKEGLDIAAEVRASFARNVTAALRGSRATARTRRELLQLLQTYDATVATALKQYLSYLSIMSEKESLSRAQLAGEWAFTQRLAARAPPAAVLAPPAFADMACNQLKRVLNRFEEKFSKVMELEQNDPSDADDKRHLVYTLCRETQTIYATEREAALQAAHWARALASRLQPRHRGRIFESLMSIRTCLVRHTDLILESSRSTQLASMPKDLRDSVSGRVRELLLQVYKLGFEIHKELHRFVNNSTQRPTFSRPNVTESSRKMKFLRSESINEEAEPNVLDETINAVGAQDDITALLAGAAAARQVREAADAAPLETECAARAARAVVQFAQCWMSFVVERCDRGRGLRPRWASQGLEFLMLACDPYNTKYLSDDEFEDLKQQMDFCISHVVGSRTPPTPTPPAPHRQRHRIHSPMSSTTSTNSKESANPPTPPETEIPLCLHSPEDTVHSKRVMEAIRQLDEKRDEKLQATKAVGKVLESTVKCYEPKLRQLTFKWQRGLKIGAGTFGKVYTVVNTESGQLLAMKELSVGAGDRRALQRAANELRVLEGVVHPHLVRYYGCELHREEMLLFMELCVEGSLEALVATSGALAEHTTRRYTKQLLSAVHELHARSIVHRDIKSGNIFLTNEGHCLKLGDFGCAVKIRANTTAPGELQGFVGTQAYMAPEVFMKSSGHGRAADIWSLGCVVTEMASGKRPFSEYDSNYQIMFVVGMGGRPHIPETLSQEGQQFCLSCLTHDPDLRPRAEALSLHHFLMVKSDDDCKCEPAYLIT